MRAGPTGAARAVAVACGLAAAAVSCATPSPRVDFSEDRRNYRANDYVQVLETWSRHEKIVRDVGTVIELWATYKSWDFRQAYVEQYASVYNLTEGERAALVASQREAARKTYEIHIAVQTTSYTWNDLEKDSSAWRVTLIDGKGAELDPAAVEIQKLPELYEAQFFPYRTEFSRTYMIRFDRAEAEGAGFAGPKSGRITLRVASPLAKAEVVWQGR